MVPSSLVIIILNLLCAADHHLTMAEGLSDEEALVSIKNHIISDPFDILQTWNESVSFCSWTGVWCGKKHRHRVTELRLASFELSGSLSPHIGNLSFLRVVDLEGNRFKGIIPREIGRLFRLKFLNLGNNSFEGDINLTSCRNLSFLYLHNNKLHGQIPAQLSLLPMLTQIFLTGNLLTGKIPPSLGNLSSLTHLILADNAIHGEIPPELGKLSRLTFLQLSSNYLSGSIPTNLFINMSYLVMFSAAVNKLSGVLPSNMFLTLPNLKGLYIGANSFSGPFPSTFTNSSKLGAIQVPINSFVGSVPLTLGSLSKLEEVNFGGNQLGSSSSSSDEEDDDFRFITTLTNSTNLRVLDVGWNNLKGMLPISVTNLSRSLTTLSFDSNYIYGTIPQGIQNLANLDTLLLHGNELTGTIPDGLGKLSKLNVLYIYSNQFSGRIPSSLGNLTSLIHLSLRDNKLEGTVPASIGNCTSLLALNLAQNHLGGELPHELFAIPSLARGLYIYQNNFVGLLPSQVGKLVHAGVLDISDNNMHGEIPLALGNCLMLESLGLQGNNFNGSIPYSFNNLTSLKVLDLSRNKLSGLIPTFLGDKLPQLEKLNLSFNMFEGEVPNGRIFNNLSSVSLGGNNKLCGGPFILRLPSCSQTNGNRRIIVTIACAISVFILLCVCGILVILCRSRNSRPQTNTASSSIEEDRYPRLSYSDLFHATQGFSSSNILGEGSFGVVYKGCYNDQIIAVKVLKLEEERGASKSFMVECEVLRNIRHRNLVKTITSCSSTDFRGNNFKALVFEFMPNGSLEKWLHPSETGTNCRFSLLQRLNIAIDVAAALDYLHHLCDNPIVHCDLKASNVLLDGDMSAHLSDFGLSKFLIPMVSHSQTSSSSIGIRGTLGYIAPEYGLGGEVSTRGDVYSFGILLLEMFTGKSPTDAIFADNFQLCECIARALSEEGLPEVVDPTLLLHWEEEPNPRKYEAMFYKCLAVILQLGIACSYIQPNSRMDIKDVVLELHKARDLYFEGTGNRRRQ